MAQKNRRKLRNTIVDGRAQFRFAAPYVMLVLISVALNFAIFWKCSNGLTVLGQRYVGSSPEIIVQVGTLQSEIFNFAAVGVVALGAVTLILWLIYSHRIFGPMVAIRKQIAQIEAGQTESSITLRRGDEFKDVLEALKRLQLKLRDRS